MIGIVLRGLLALALVAGIHQAGWAQAGSSANWPLGLDKPAAQPGVTAATTTTPSPLLVAQIPASAAPATCTGPVDPYKNYACLDTYLGDNVFERFFNYYRLEWGEAGPPTDPSAPSPNIEGWPRTPGTVPPLAYTEWPTGAMTTIGNTRPNGADSPFMAAIANTSLGQWMQENHLQFYGWINGGFNISTNSLQPAGNGPIGYAYTPNTAQLDQAVVYLDRWPDTVQTDHFDWGGRLSFLWGENYRYTNSYGVGSYQFNGQNAIYGWDPVMEYVDLYWPKPFGGAIEGVNVRVGRYISIPDIEAQLAPNNLTYTHSLTYTWDNYTNTGIVASWQVTPQILVQTGITDGTETPIWHWGNTIPNLLGPNPLFPGTRYNKDPGNQPSATFCVQFRWNNGWDTFYPCLDGLNDGSWGYNNLQWHGFTYYHRFNDQWHNDFESYYLSENGVPNLRNPTALSIFNNGGTPFSPQNVPYNPPNLVYCPNPNVLKCSPHSIGVLDYLNYTPDPLNNFTLRLEWYNDPYGWRTGTGGRTQYYDTGISWQHWLSPQVEFRPEITYWRSIGTPAFNGFVKKQTAMFASDMIFHF